MKIFIMKKYQNGDIKLPYMKALYNVVLCCKVPNMHQLIGINIHTVMDLIQFATVNMFVIKKENSGYLTYVDESAILGVNYSSLVFLLILIWNLRSYHQYLKIISSIHERINKAIEASDIHFLACILFWNYMQKNVHSKFPACAYVNYT